MANKEINKIQINGDDLKEAIRSSGYSIRNLANEIGYSDRQIRTYLKQNEMPYNMYIRIYNKVYRDWFEPLHTDYPVIDNAFNYKYIQRKPKAHEDFFDWLACSVVMESDWEENPGFYREVICRKLVRIGKLKIVDDCYVLPDPEIEKK